MELSSEKGSRATLPIKARHVLTKVSCAVVLGAVLGLAVGCAPQIGKAQLAEGESLKITKQVWDGYNQYSRALGSHKEGAFAVAVYDDVGVGYFYNYCPRKYDRCFGAIASDAVKRCEERGTGCLIFAQNGNIVVPYEVIDE